MVEFQEFTNGDTAYLRWLDQHPAGYVINTPRGRPTSYMLLHRATCWTIGPKNRNVPPGGFTERDYIKVCAEDVATLRVWTQANGRTDGSFSKVCAICSP
ncbi:MAG: hypothetical protein L0322_15935 [Chloroflexi bacterium]|nr:hypothetical protein [Chloroflexota bacterium]